VDDDGGENVFFEKLKLIETFAVAMLLLGKIMIHPTNCFFAGCFWGAEKSV